MEFRENLQKDHFLCGDECACIYVRRLLSGRPSNPFRRFLVLNQIWFDDSGKHGGPVFVLAGFLANVEEWIWFASKWQDLLADKNRRKLDYIKGYEAFGLRDQFMRWTDKERDDRLMEFMPIIGEYSGKGLAIVIPHDKFAEIIKQPEPRFEDPHIYAYAICFSLMLHFAHGDLSRPDRKYISGRSENTSV